MDLILFVLFILVVKYIYFNPVEVKRYILMFYHWSICKLAKRYQWAEDHFHFMYAWTYYKSDLQRRRVFKQCEVQDIADQVDIDYPLTSKALADYLQNKHKEK